MKTFVQTWVQVLQTHSLSHIHTDMHSHSVLPSWPCSGPNVSFMLFSHSIMWSMTKADAHFSLSLEIITESSWYGSEGFLLWRNIGLQLKPPRTKENCSQGSEMCRKGLREWRKGLHWVNKPISNPEGVKINIFFLYSTDVVLLIGNPEMFKGGRGLSCQCHWILMIDVFLRLF